MKLNRNGATMRRLAIWTLSILIASALSGCASKLQPVYVLNGARVTDVWLEKVRKLELAESAE